VRAKGNGGTYAYFACVGRIIGKGCEQRYLPVEAVEQAVANYWHRVELRPEQASEVRKQLATALTGMRQNADREVRRQRRRIVNLKRERQKLLEAFYADAIAVDHLKAEQDRISGEVAVGSMCAWSTMPASSSSTPRHRLTPTGCGTSPSGCAGCGCGR
jgi:site-specific DNA recombinase